MSRYTPIELSIPTPCSQNWEEMSVNDAGRFCDNCNKTVIDFTHYSDQQLADFFKRSKGKVCGKFKDDQLEKPLHALQNSQNRSLPQLLISAALVIGLGNNAYVENIDPMNVLITVNGEKDGERNKTTIGNGNKYSISGCIIDGNTKETLPGVTIVLKGSHILTVSDINGNFKLVVPTRFVKDTINLTISIYGFESKTIKIAKKDFSLNTIIELNGKQDYLVCDHQNGGIDPSLTTKGLAVTKMPIEMEPKYWQRLKRWFKIKNK